MLKALNVDLRESLNIYVGFSDNSVSDFSVSSFKFFIWAVRAKIFGRFRFFGIETKSRNVVGLKKSLTFRTLARNSRIGSLTTHWSLEAAAFFRRSYWVSHTIFKLSLKFTHRVPFSQMVSLKTCHLVNVRRILKISLHGWSFVWVVEPIFWFFKRE